MRQRDIKTEKEKETEIDPVLPPFENLPETGSILLRRGML